MWRLSSADGKSWVQCDGGRFTTSADAVRAVVDADLPVEVAPMTGLMYSPAGPDDQVSVFLHAREVIGWPQRVTGTPPAGVPVPDAAPAGDPCVG